MSEALHSRPVREADRAHVLGVAARLFREHGFDATSLKQIAEACNILPGSLHYRYRTKQSLLLDLMCTGLEHVNQAVLRACMETSDPGERIRAALRAHLRTLVQDSDMVYVLLFEWRALTPAARDQIIGLRDEYEDNWMRMLRTLQEMGLVRPDIDLNLLRLIGFGAVNWVVTWYREGDRYTLDEIADFIWNLIAGALMTGNTPDA